MLVGVRFLRTVRRGTLLIRSLLPVGPYSSPMPRELWWYFGGGHHELVLKRRAGRLVLEEQEVVFGKHLRLHLLHPPPSISRPISRPTNDSMHRCRDSEAALCGMCIPVAGGLFQARLQGYLAHKKTPTPLGPS